jgi:hypothetical protein
MYKLNDLYKYNRKAVKGYLFMYNAIKEQIKSIEDSIISSGLIPTSDGLPHANNVGNPTQNKAIRLSEFDELNYMRSIVSAIESVRSDSRMVERKVMDYYFIQGKDYKTVCIEIPISQNDLYTIARSITKLVAEKLKIPV